MAWRSCESCKGRNGWEIGVVTFSAHDGGKSIYEKNEKNEQMGREVAMLNESMEVNHNGKNVGSSFRQ